MPLPKLDKWYLCALLLLHVALGAYYSVTIPIWEAHDEIGHYYFARYLATEHQLVPPGKKVVALQDESRQPPLYYLLAALPVSLVDVKDGLAPKLNPHMMRGPASGGYNRVVHDAATESWPYRGTVLAVHLARLVSVLLGTLGLLLTYLAARGLFPGEPWIRWGAVLTMAFWPLYRFSSAVVNNDVMVTVCAAAIACLLVRTVAVDRLKVGDLLALGVVSGLTLLSKNNGLGVLVPVPVVLAARILPGRRWLRRRELLCALGGMALALLLAGWWYVRNLAGGVGLLAGQHGLIWRLQRFIRWTTEDPVARARLALAACQKGVFSLWASFGWGNVGLPLATYWAAGVFALLGLVGLILWVSRRPPRRQVAGAALLSLLVLGVGGLAIAYSLGGRAPQVPGRYLLPALPALCVVFSVGWHQLLPRRLLAPGWVAISGVLAVLAVVTPARYIQPRYAPAPRLTEAQAAAYVPVHGTFGGFAELVGYRVESQFLDPRGTLHLTLVWRALARTEMDYTLAVQVFAEGRSLLGEANRYPGWGTYPTTRWEPGTLFVDQFAIPIKSREPGARPGWVEVSFYCKDGKALIPIDAFDAGGHLAGQGLRLTRVKIRGTAASGAMPGLGARFGQAIHLAGVRAEVAAGQAPQDIRLGLVWAATGQPERDYTVSLQLRDERNAIVAQVDSPPQAGEFPTTLWEIGETVSDTYTLTLPADVPDGTYTLYVCLYDGATMQRLSAGLEGEQLPGDEAALFTCSTVSARVSECRAGYSWVSVSCG